ALGDERAVGDGDAVLLVPLPDELAVVGIDGVEVPGEVAGVDGVADHGGGAGDRGRGRERPGDAQLTDVGRAEGVLGGVVAAALRVEAGRDPVAGAGAVPALQGFQPDGDGAGPLAERDWRGA